jgi:exopolysaccharide biosynthesis protein
MKRALIILFIVWITGNEARSQMQWTNVDRDFGSLPGSVHVYFSDHAPDTGVFRAYYLVADLQDKNLAFTTDTTSGRRLTPAQFYQKNGQPVAVVNCTFFSFETNRNLNLVVKNGKLVAFNLQSLPGKGKDTLTYRHPVASALGITRDRRADVAWVLTDSSQESGYAFQHPVSAWKDSNQNHSLAQNIQLSMKRLKDSTMRTTRPEKWKMETAVGGGPVLVQDGKVAISNNEELKFGGKGIFDRHPRTAMGYTEDGKLIILVIEGRNPKAQGATLTEEAQILKDLGCVEALNLDGGGSSCLLVNGKETIQPSDKKQRPVPGVFIIAER